MTRLARCMAAVACALGPALLPAPAGADGSVRCDGGIVSVGDSKLDLVGKCGWPALREEDHLGERTTVLRPRRGEVLWNRSFTGTSERWTYDFGPNRFVQLVVLELGRIVRIERGGYGYGREPPARDPVPRARCGDAVFHEGELTYDVLARCGAPAFREVGVELHALVLGDERPPAVQPARVTVEVWTYDFGPLAFVRYLTFEDGKLVRVETGGYGYAR